YTLCMILFYNKYFYLTVYMLISTCHRSIYPLPLHDALPIWCIRLSGFFLHAVQHQPFSPDLFGNPTDPLRIKGSRTAGLSILPGDRKSTRLNSSHVSISYAVFCLKKKKH